MAAGDSSVGIVNKALLLLGAEPITSFTDGSAAGAAASTIYNEIKLTTLGMYPWSFTISKGTLARSTTTPNNEWTYEYIMPSDMLTGVPRAVRSSSIAGAGINKGWEIGQSTDGNTVLFTEETEVHIDYQKSVGEGSMPTYFVQLLAYQMAWHLAEVITDQTTKMEHWKAVALGTPGEGMRGGFFRQAANIDSAGQTPQVISDYMLVDVR